MGIGSTNWDVVRDEIDEVQDEKVRTCLFLLATAIGAIEHRLDEMWGRM
jgi:hypothetical protein